MDRICERLAVEPRLAFTSLFEAGMHRSQMVGIFLAVLELIRHFQVQAEQNELFGEIWILAHDAGSRASLQVVDDEAEPS